VLELSAATTRALVRWRDGYAAAVRKRQATVDELLGAREALGEDEYMRGHVHKRGGTWSVVYDEQPSEDGKRRQRTKGGFATRREAQAFLTKTLARIGDGTYARDPACRAASVGSPSSYFDGSSRGRSKRRDPRCAHVHARPAEGDTLILKQAALAIPLRERAVRADHAMPGNAGVVAARKHGPGEAGSPWREVAVGGHAAVRDGSHPAQQRFGVACHARLILARGS
jgi:Arm DNA-binding domain